MITMYTIRYNHSTSIWYDFEAVDIYCLLYYPNTIKIIRQCSLFRSFTTVFFDKIIFYKSIYDFHCCSKISAQC